MPLFLPSGEAGDAADVILVDDDHDYAFRATIENMGQNRSVSLLEILYRLSLITNELNSTQLPLPLLVRTLLLLLLCLF